MPESTRSGPLGVSASDLRSQLDPGAVGTEPGASIKTGAAARTVRVAVAVRWRSIHDLGDQCFAEMCPEHAHLVTRFVTNDCVEKDRAREPPERLRRQQFVHEDHLRDIGSDTMHHVFGRALSVEGPEISHRRDYGAAEGRS